MANNPYAGLFDTNKPTIPSTQNTTDNADPYAGIFERATTSAQLQQIVQKSAQSAPASVAQPTQPITFGTGAPAAPKPTPENPFAGQEIKAAPPEPSFWGKVSEVLHHPFTSQYSPLVQSEADQMQQAHDVYVTTKIINEKLKAMGSPNEVSDVQVSTNLNKYKDAFGIERAPTNVEVVGKLMAIPIVAGLASNPFATAAGLAAFTALDKAENWIATKVTGKDVSQLSDVLPDTTNQTTKDIVDILDFIAKGAVIGGVYKKAPGLVETFTKDVTVKYNLPKVVYLDPVKVRSIFGTGNAITAEETQLYKSLGLNHEEVVNAVKNGVSVSVPTEKITTVADKPYWAKLKQAIGIEPSLETRVETGKTVVAPRALLEAPAEQPKAPPTPVMEATKPVLPADQARIEYDTAVKDFQSGTTPQTAALETKITDLRNQLDIYNKTNSENVLTVPREDSGINALSIKVAPLNNGQFQYSYEVNTNGTGITADFLTNQLAKTREEAITSAKEAITTWAQRELEQATGKDQMELQNILAEVQKVNPKQPAILTTAMDRIRAVASENGFATVTERAKPIIDRVNNQNAPTGVIPGRKELQVHLPTLNEDIQHLLAGKSMEVTIGGKTITIQRTAGQTDTELVHEYVKALMDFESQHLKQATVGEATAIEQGKGAEVAKGMDERVQGKKEIVLPWELAGAKPRYGFGSKLFTLDFKSDIDKALYIVAQEKRSKADAQYMDFLRGVFPNSTDEQIRAKGVNVRAAIKELARDGEPGNLVIKKITAQEQPTQKTAKLPKSPKVASPVETATKVMPKRASLPVLQEFKVKDGNLYTTDLTVAVKLKSGIAEGMYKVVGKEAVKTETHIDDFPMIPEVTEKPIVSVPSAELQDAIKTASNFSSNSQGSRPEIDGVLMRLRDGKITVVATDSFRLYTKTIEANIQGSADVIIAGADTVAKVLTAIGDNADISISKSEGNATQYVKFGGANGEVIAKVVDGTFPAWEQIIPSFKVEYTFDRSAMLSAVKELKPYAKTIPNEMLTIEYKDGAFKLVAEDKKQNIRKEISVPAISKTVNTEGGAVNDGILVMPVRGEGEGNVFAYNRAFIEDALKSLSEPKTHFYGTDSLKETPGFFSDNAELQSKKVAPPKIERKRAPSGMAATGADKIGNFEELAGIANKNAEQFKIYEKVKELVKKYANTIGENYLPRNALGVYYGDTTNVRIKGINYLSVAAHEITHFLDHAYNISDQLMGVKGYSIAGNPIYESRTYKLRRELSKLYEENYPGASPDQPLKKRMVEGFATLLQKYTESPSMTTAKYPNVVREFLTSEGSFYKPVMGEIISDLRNIIAEYQGLPALDKIGARIVNDQVNVNKDSFLNFFEKVKTEIADNIYPIEVLAKKAGVRFTKADPSLWVRQYNNSNALILNNLNGDRGFWGWRNGELTKLHDFNWKTLIRDVQQGKNAEAFGSYLVARREYFLFKELADLNTQIEKLTTEVNAMTQEQKDAAVGEADNPVSLLKQAQKQADELSAITGKDGFTEKEVMDAYTENKDRFAEHEKKYDALVQEDLHFLSDPAVQLLAPDEKAKLMQQQGYASFKRYFYDEVVGEDTTATTMRVGKTKVSSLLRRTGSQKPIINPLFSALRNHAEITRKGLKQAIYNRMADVAINNPDLGVFQRLQLQAVPDRMGRILFPQEKDPNIIMARVGYKRVPILTEGVIKKTIDEVLNFQNIGIFEKLLLGSSRFFTKGTTGLFPGFALTNYAVDQVTAAAQTRNNYMPLYDPLSRIAKMLKKDTPDHAFLQEYLVMGGERQTFVGWQDMAPNELFSKINNERKGLLKVVDALNAGMNVLALPSQWSEVMTRATEYVKSREAGKSQLVALEEAGRVTAPFHHVGRLGGGRIGQVAIKSIPFFNPAIQVLAQAAETMETPAGRRRYGFVALAVTAATIAGLGLVLGAGSDEQKKQYADIHPDELNKYVWYPLPGGKGLGKIRVPDQMNVIATLINMIIADKKLQAQYTAGEYLNAGVSWLPQQFDVSQPAKMLLSWIPQIIKPGVLTLAGVKDFPKIMPIESQSLQSRSPGQRFTASTSPVAKKLGEALNISPLKIDYLLTGYLGRSIGFVTGKPNIYNPFTSLSSTYYFESGRKLQSFYDARAKNDQDYYDYTHKLRSFNFGERTKILQQRAKLAQVTALIGLYRDIDPEKKPDKAAILRDKIFKKLDGL